MTYALAWWVYLVRLGLRNQEIFKLRGTYQHSSGGACKTSKRHLAKIRLGKLGFERRPPRRAHCISFEILDDVARIFSDIASGGGRYGDRRPREREVRCRSGNLGRWMGADFIALISTLRFLDPALVMVLTATRFREMVDVILVPFIRWM